MVIAVLLFSSGFAERMLSGQPFPSTEVGVVAAFILTLPAYAFGDAALVAITSRLQKLNRRGLLFKIIRGGVVLDHAFVVVHAVSLNLLGWSCWNNSSVFNGCAVFLAIVNIGWLGVKIRTFRLIDRFLSNPRRRKLRQDLRECLEVMRVWNALNMSFILVLALIAITTVSVGPSFAIVEQIVPWFAALRSLIDLILCNKFYADVLLGKYQITNAN
jgi:divalent metal cation (Fe/Co/Zn/Cd) transporter